MANYPGTTGNDTYNGSAADDDMFGLEGNDVLNGADGNDSIYGGVGNDTMNGGNGNDHIDAGAGIDSIDGSTGRDLITLDLSNEVVAVSYNAVTAATNGGVTLVDGTTVKNVEGLDSLTTGAGNDTLTINTATAQFFWAAGAGSDRLIGDFSADTGGIVSYTNGGNDFTIYDNIGTFSSFGTSIEAATLTGGSGADNLGGTTGSDSLSGGSSEDTLSGGLGNDVLNGDAGNDSLSGNDGNDTLNGGVGNDHLNAGSGVDVVDGGTGLDSLTLDLSNEIVAVSVNMVTAATSGGVTLVDGTTVKNAEALDSLTTGSANDTLTVNLATAQFYWAAGAGSDRLIGDFSADAGGIVAYANGSDFTIYDNIGTFSSFATSLEAATLTGGSGADILSSTLGNDSLMGGDGADTLSGAAGNDVLNGDAANDSLSGEDGNDTLSGGAGDDHIAAGTGSDAVDGGTGRDSLTLDLSNEIVAVSLNMVTAATSGGVTLVDGTTVKNAEALDSLTTGSANDSLTVNLATAQFYWAAGAGSDRLIGDFSADTSGIVAYTNGGSDFTIYDNIASFSSFATSLDAVTLTGGSGADIFSSTLGNDSLMGGDGADTLSSAAGDDVLNGDAGNDSLSGNDGNDTINGGVGDDRINAGTGLDSVDGGSGRDGLVLDMSDALLAISYNAVAAATNGGVALADGSTVKNVEVLDDLVTGAGNDTLTLNLATGQFTWHAGAGNDLLIGDFSADVGGIGAFASGTNYTVYDINGTINSFAADIESVNLTGGSGLDDMSGTNGNDTLNGAVGDDSLNGGAGNDSINGGAGGDGMVGGTGDDTFVVDNANDIVSESSGQGTDQVQSSRTYTLGSNVENLTLIGSGVISGTGNTLNNVMVGNAMNNLLAGLAGNDSLDGGLGNDTLRGGAGNDSYIVENASDVVSEETVANVDDTGTDTVFAGVTYSLGKFVENLTLTGAAAINGTGNNLANSLTGNTAANALDGGAGNDTLTGGLGADTYIIDASGDVIVENSGEGTDSVLSSVAHSLGANVENLTLTGAAAINGTGNGGDNILTGNSGNNRLDGLGGADQLTGGLGNDSLYGGAGNDTYIIDDASDTVSEETVATVDDGGTDEVRSAVSYSLGNFVENLVLTGAAAHGNGNGLNNAITGTSGANRLDGGAGNDTLTGGAGDDTYVIDSTGDSVVEAIGAGTDTAEASATWTMSANVEILVQTGIGNIDGTDNGLDNVMTGNGGNNHLIGGGGNDTLNGGLGNDTLEDSAGSNQLHGGDGDDFLYSNSTSYGSTFDGGDGSDTLDLTAFDNFGVVVDLVNGTYSDAGGFETLVSIENLNGGARSDVFTGSDAANILNGNAGDDSLYAGNGNDTVHGGSGDDVMYAGNGFNAVYGDDGNDYVQTQSDSYNNAYDGGDGRDTIDYSWAFGNYNAVIDLTLGSYVDDFGNDTVLNFESVLGTQGSETIIGNATDNSLYGYDGNDALDGRSGSDTLSGGLGDDSFYVDSNGDVVIENASEGTDSVFAAITFTLGANFENLTLVDVGNINGTGNGDNNVITGNTGNNALIGGGGNDWLDGGLGADTLTGGAGDDVFVYTTGDVLVEAVGEGNDGVYSAFSLTLGANIENLVLTGVDAVNGTGNALANSLTGNDGANTLTGLAGNDVLDGSAGADTLLGGAGHDTYVVDNAGDVITEIGGQGTDVINASVTYTMGASIEVLNLTGVANIDGTGNSNNNVLNGNVGNNALNGGAGIDTMNGGLGDDTYYVNDAGDRVLEGDGGGTDTVFAGISYSGAGQYIENITLLGSGDFTALGNGVNNVLRGNAANNDLNGSGGADTMIGGAGNDTYTVENVGDVVTETGSPGVDVVNSRVSFDIGTQYIEIVNLTFNGNANAYGSTTGRGETLNGNTANNILDGRSGADTLTGGLGNDSYYVDNAGDLVTENAAEGTDLVNSYLSYTLGANFENLTLLGAGNLTGTGNAFDNTIIGTTGNNKLFGLDGNDRLDGAAGNDTLTGGLGNDTYVVDSATDSVVELSGEGTDTVQASVSYSLGAAADIEILTLTGTADINATGNTLLNTLNGNTGNNVLDGGTGADTLLGGGGNDTYVIDNAGDVTVDGSTGGTGDTVNASVTYTLGSSAYIEIFNLTGAANINATGNNITNVITGNGGANVLDGGNGADILNGGAGNDTLIGGAAADAFVFGLGSGQDVVNDFKSSQNDTVDIHAYSNGVVNGGGVMIHQSGTSAIIDLGGGNTITVLNTTASDPNFLSHIVW